MNDILSTTVSPVSGKSWINRAQPYVFLFLIICASTVVRFSHQSLHHTLTGDEDQYIGVAKNVFEGKGYVIMDQDPASATHMRSPTFIMPAYVGAVVLAHTIFGYDDRNALYANLVFSVLLIFVVFIYARKLSSSVLVGLLAAFFSAFDPVLTKMTGFATKDLSYCLAVFIVALVLLHKENKLYYVWLILAMSLLVLSRKFGYWFFVPLLLHFLTDGRERTVRRNIIAFCAVSAVTAVLVCPWYILVRDPHWNEVADVAKVIMFSGNGSNVPGQGGSFSVFFIARHFKEQVEIALRTIISGSILLNPILLFIPILFAVKRRQVLDLFWGGSLAMFLVIFSLLRIEETTLDYYYLPFFPVLTVYALFGMVRLGEILRFGKIKMTFLVASVIMISCIPYVDTVRNHVHPKLRAKFSNQAKYAEISSVVQWLNAHTGPNDHIATSSRLRHYWFKLSSPVQNMPTSADSFTSDYMAKHAVNWVVVDSTNLEPVESATARGYLKQWWRLEDGKLEEKSIPLFLISCYNTKTIRVYRVACAN